MWDKDSVKPPSEAEYEFWKGVKAPLDGVFKEKIKHELGQGVHYNCALTLGFKHDYNREKTNGCRVYTIEKMNQNMPDGSELSRNDIDNGYNSAKYLVTLTFPVRKATIICTNCIKIYTIPQDVSEFLKKKIPENLSLGEIRIITKGKGRPKFTDSTSKWFILWEGEPRTWTYKIQAVYTIIGE